MKDTNPSHDVELLSPEIVRDDFSPCQSRQSSRKSIDALRSWFRRIVLLSGTQYDSLNQPRRTTSLRYGWKLGSLMSCILVGAVLCFNTASTIYFLRTRPPQHDGIGQISSGECDELLSASTKIHISINAMSTILVAASNYNMQCLTAPTRTEITEAHRRRRYLEIGGQSLRNLAYIPRWKLLLWSALLLSTLPLHLLWNSAIFSVTTINEYASLVVSSDFLTVDDPSGGLDCNDTALLDYQRTNDNESWAIRDYTTCWLLSEAKQNRLTRLTPSECIRKYTLRLETAGYNLIAVTNNRDAKSSRSFPQTNASLPVLAYFESISFSSQLEKWCKGQCDDWLIDGSSDSTTWCNSTASPSWASNALNTSLACYEYVNNGSAWKPDDLTGKSDWTCDPDHIYSSGCSVSSALTNSTKWTILPEHYEIDHCLVSEALFQCQLEYSSSALYAVVACNAVKFLAILLHLVFAREPIFATCGDAVSSFLAFPDDTTKGDCLYSSHNTVSDFYELANRWRGPPGQLKPRIWKCDLTRVERWIQGTSWTQFMLCGAAYVSASNPRDGLTMADGFYALSWARVSSAKVLTGQALKV